MEQGVKCPFLSNPLKGGSYGSNRKPFSLIVLKIQQSQKLTQNKYWNTNTCDHTSTVSTSPECSLVGNVLCTGGNTFRLILLQENSLLGDVEPQTVFFLASTFCVLSSSTWLELGPPLPPSPSQIISSISALEAVESGRTTLTRGKSPVLPPACDTRVLVEVIMEENSGRRGNFGKVLEKRKYFYKTHQKWLQSKRV